MTELQDCVREKHVGSLTGLGRKGGSLKNHLKRNHYFGSGSETIQTGFG